MSRAKPPSTRTSSTTEIAERPKARLAHDRRRRILTILLSCLFVLLVGSRWMLSPLATSVVNKKLAALPNYRGQVGAVKVVPWRAAIATGPRR